MKQLFFCMFLLSGCSIDNSCYIEKTVDVEYIDNYGLTLQPSKRMFVTPEQVSQYYQETMVCMGMTAAAPDVAFKSFSANYIGGSWAIYIGNGKTVWVNTDIDELYLPRSCETDKQALKHEFIHHILTMNGMRDSSNRHNSPLFKCGYGVDNNR